jgi:ATP-dependent Clp protease protease subunit
MKADATVEVGATGRTWKFESKPKAQVAEGYDAEFLLYDVIGGGGLFFGGVSAEHVYHMINEVPGGKVLVRINSAGGSVTEGMAIYNLLKEHKAEVTTRVDGIAGSIASIILMAGDKREIAPNAYVMIHNPYAQVMGEEDEIRAIADLLSKNKQSMYAIYAARTGLPTEEIKALCDKTSYLSAEESVRMGFCTRMTGGKAQMLASFGELKDAPEKLQRAVQAAARTETPKAKAMDEEEKKDTESKAEEGKDDRDEQIKDLKAKLAASDEKEVNRLKEEIKALKARMEENSDAKAEGDEDEDEDEPKAKAKTKSEDADDEEIKAANRVVTLAMELTGCKDRRVLEGQLMAYIDRAGTQTNTHEARVKALIAEGKLAPARKKWALEASAANLDAYIAAIGNQAILPVNQEHKPNDEAGKVKAQVEIDPSKVELTADEIKICNQMGTDKVKFLAMKRASLTGQA